MVEDLDLILETITTVARRCIKKAWPFGPQCDQIDFFFFGSETIFDVFRHFKSHVIISPPWLINFTCDSLWKEEKIAGTGRLSECRRIKSPISDMPDIGDFIPQSRGLANIAIAAPSTIGDFRRSPWSAYKIARCVALVLLYVIASSVVKSLAKKFVFLVENQRQLCLQRNKNGSPKRSKGTSNEACAVILSLCLTGIISNKAVETFCVIILNYPTL